MVDCYHSASYMHECANGVPTTDGCKWVPKAAMLVNRFVANTRPICCIDASSPFTRSKNLDSWLTYLACARAVDDIGDSITVVLDLVKNTLRYRKVRPAVPS